MQTEVLRVISELNKANDEWLEADRARTVASKKYAKLQLELEALQLKVRRVKANET